MNKLFQLLILSIVLHFTQQILENSIWHVYNSITEINDEIYDKDFLVAILFYQSGSCWGKCAEIEKPLEQFSEKMKGIINFIIVDCTIISSNEKKYRNIFPICFPKENNQKLPALKFYHNQKNKFDYETGKIKKALEYEYKGEFNQQALNNFSLSIMPIHSVIIDSINQFDEFLKFQDLPNKVLYFHNKSTTSALFRAVTSVYKDRIDFAEIKPNNKTNSLIEKYNIAQFPSLLILKQNKNQFEQINFNNSMTLQNLKNFISKYARILPIMRNEDKYKGFPELQSISIDQYYDSIMKSKKYILVHFKGKESHNALPELIAKFENLYEYFEIDCNRKRTKNFAREELDVNKFPSLIFIHAEKKEIIDIFSDRMSSYDIIARTNELIRDNTYHIKHSEAQSYLDKISRQTIPTVIYFSKTEDDIGIIFKSCALLPQFKNKINFARIIDAPYQIMTLYQINRRSDIVAIIGKKTNILNFKEVFSVKNIFEFLNLVINEFNQKKDDL